jgi:hypothetical protein
MFTAFVVLLVLFQLVSMVGVSIGIDNTPQKEGKAIQIGTVSGSFAALGLLLSSLTLAIIVRTWVTVTMWGWFVTPLFNIPAPTKAQAYGLALFVSLFVANMKAPTDSTTKSQYLNTYIFPMFAMLTIYGFGWLTQRFFL